MTPPEIVAAAVLMAALLVLSTAALRRAIDPTPVYVDRVVARSLLDLAQDLGSLETEWRGTTLRLDRLLDGRWVVVLHRGQQVSETVVDESQALDEIVRWRRGGR